jgi:hypothetical protein
MNRLHKIRRKLLKTKVNKKGLIKKKPVVRSK